MIFVFLLNEKDGNDVKMIIVKIVRYPAVIKE